MLRSSLRSARLLAGTPAAVVAGRQWPIATSRHALVPGLVARVQRSFSDQKKAEDGAPKPPVLPPSETLSSEPNPTPSSLGVPLTPPGPTASSSGTGEETPTQDQQDDAPVQPQKRGFFYRLKRLVITLFLVGTIGFGAGVWYSRFNDKFHDYFTEYVPFAEQAILFLENLEVRKRALYGPRAQPQPRDTSEPLKVPAHSGASWRAADQGEPAGRHSNASSTSKQSASKPPPKSQTPKSQDKKASPPPATKESKPKKGKSVEKVAAGVSPTTIDSSKSPVANFKAPEVDEPSRFPPLAPIDLLALPDSKDPVVGDLVRMVNDLILVINADGAHAKYGSTMNKAKTEITKVGEKLRMMKDGIEKKAASEVRSSIQEFDEAATELIKRVDNTMRAQEMEWRREFEEEMKKVRESYDERVKLITEREQKLGEEKIQVQLLQQALALKKDFVRQVREHVEQEREGRLGKLAELSSAVSDLEKLTVGWNDVVDTNLKTQQLHTAVDAVRASLEDSQHPRPFIRELVALREIGSDDEVVHAAIASLNPVAYQRGISAPSQLIDRFRRVAAEVRKASLLPEDAGVASHVSSWLLSHVMFKKQGLVKGNDVESVLTRTQTLLEEGDLDGAAREMNSLQGWAKTLSQDWLAEVRRVLEVQQALEVISTEARLQSLRVG